MKKEQILRKVIEKAQKNGWKSLLSNWHWEVESIEGGTLVFFWVEDKPTKGTPNDGAMSTSDILFDHGFAKAFFGEKTYTRKRILIKPTSRVSRVGTIDVQGFHKRQKFLKNKGWQYHLQQLVLLPDEDRINYLERFLE